MRGLLPLRSLDRRNAGVFSIVGPLSLAAASGDGPSVSSGWFLVGKMRAFEALSGYDSGRSCLLALGLDSGYGGCGLLDIGLRLRSHDEKCNGVVRW